MGIKVPRLSKGKGIKGPEPFGCFNTGVAPVIMRSKVNGKYLVGLENDVYDARQKLCFSNYANVRVIYHIDSKRDVRIYKTRAPAVAKFTELCEKQIAQNKTFRDEYQQARKDAQSKDYETALKGALNMADY